MKRLGSEINLCFVCGDGNYPYRRLFKTVQTCNCQEDFGLIDSTLVQKGRVDEKTVTFPGFFSTPIVCNYVKLHVGWPGPEFSTTE